MAKLMGSPCLVIAFLSWLAPPCTGHALVIPSQGGDLRALSASSALRTRTRVGVMEFGNKCYEGALDPLPANVYEVSATCLQ